MYLCVSVLFGSALGKRGREGRPLDVTGLPSEVADSPVIELVSLVAAVVADASACDGLLSVLVVELPLAALLAEGSRAVVLAVLRLSPVFR